MNLKKTIPFLILLLTIPSIIQWLDFDTDRLTIVWWTIEILILYTFIKGRKVYFINQSLPTYVKFFIVLVFCQAVHGIFRSDGYWDYKVLIGNLLTYLLPLCIFVFSSPPILSVSQRTWFKYGLILFWVVLPVMQPEAPGKFLIPVLFALLVIKPIPLRYKIIILLYFSFIFIYGSLGARASVAKYVIALLFGVGMYLNIYRFKYLVRITYALFLLAPIVLFVLGVSGVFNVFQLDKYLIKDQIEVTGAFNKSEKENLTSDTRTFIYQEAIHSAFKNEYVLLGNSLARGYESIAFADTDFYKRGERYDSEVSIINIFTHFGLLGVVIYWLIFISASYKAIFKSNNTYMVMIGLYVAFRWCFAWVEDFSRFDLNYLYLWIMISMCYSPFYRKMNGREFQYWVSSIFKRRNIRRLPHSFPVTKYKQEIPKNL